MMRVEMLASIPPIQSAIKISGDGGARVQFDVPETYIDEVWRLAKGRGKVLKLTVEIADEGDE